MPRTSSEHGTGRGETLSSEPGGPREPGRGGRGGGGGFGPGPVVVNPRDREQLAESPVSGARVARLFAPHTTPIVVVTAIIVVTSLVGLASPFLLREVIDVALPQQNLGLLVTLVAAMLAVTVITSMLGVVQTWISTQVGQRVMHTLRTSVFTHLQGQSLGFFTRTRGGEIQSRLTNDIAGMQSVVTTTATSIATNATTAIATAAAMITLSWRLSLLTLVVLPPAIWLTRRVALMRRETTTQQQRRMADLSAQVEEGLSVSGILLSKTLGAGAASAQRFEATSAELVDLEMRAQLAGRWRMATMQIIFAAIPALIYLAAGFPATSQGMTIGTLIAFATLQSAIFRPMMGLLNVAAQWVTSMALFSRIFGYLDTETDVPEPAHPVAVELGAVAGEVRFEAVGYSYPDSDTAALTGIDLTVPAGTSLALVGATGSGKSTLASLVARLRDPSTGRVTIDGHDLRDLDAPTIAAMVGVVTQDTYLTHTSIRQNLLMAKPDATDDELWTALRTAQIADFVAGQPRELDTVVGSRGMRFSGGEQQRLAVARTLLRDPAVLVLDEATSALDNTTERALQLALDELARGRTTITIAHRLSTIRRADRIAVLDAGRIVELGSHDELLSAGGRFAALADTPALA